MRGVGLGVSFAVVSVSSVAYAQNADPYFFGDDAALSAGAVTASSRDSGSLWYNPAGLGGITRGSISASATTFGIRLRKIPRALRTQFDQPGRSSDLVSTDILAVPNTIVASGALSKRVGFSAALLTTQRDLRSSVSPSTLSTGTLDGVPIQATQRIDQQQDSNEYHLGGGLGVALTDSLRIGAAAFVTYAKATTSLQYALSLAAPSAEPPDAAFLTLDARVTRTVIGAGGSIGVQWQPSATTALGLSFRTPELGVHGWSDGGASQAYAASGSEPSYVDQPAPAPKALGRVIAPARLLAGAAFRAGDKTWLELGVDAAHGLPDTSLGPARRVVVNGRVGVRVALSPQWVLGGGAFTDRALLRDVPRQVGADRVDYYGVTLGFSKRTPLSLVKNPAPDALVLVTTFSLRAAVGFGEARATTVDLRSTAERDDRSSVVFLDLMPYFGSSVLF